MPIVALLSLSLSNVALVLLAFKAAEKPAAQCAAPAAITTESEASDPCNRTPEPGRLGRGTQRPAAGGAVRPRAKGDSQLASSATPSVSSSVAPSGGLAAGCGAQASPAREGPAALKAPDDTRVEMLRGSGGEPAAPSPVQEEVGERDAE